MKKIVNKITQIYQNEISLSRTSNLYISLSVGLGIFSAFLPIWGFQTIFAVLSASVTKLNRVIVVAASSVSFAIAPFIIVLAYNTGKFLIPNHKHINLDNFSWLSVQDDLLTFLVGSTAAAILAGSLITLVVYLILSIFRKKTVIAKI